MLEALARLKGEAKVVIGDGKLDLVDADAAKGCFVAPTLLRCDDPAGARTVHEV